MFLRRRPTTIFPNSLIARRLFLLLLLGREGIERCIGRFCLSESEVLVVWLCSQEGGPGGGGGGHLRTKHRVFQQNTALLRCLVQYTYNYLAYSSLKLSFLFDHPVSSARYLSPVSRLVVQDGSG